MSSTIFIAVQCCQCSTMQVKQKKKSSGKWNCAVCNQKQSIRKVFAQGFVAKDIRKLVQSFNMSRKSADEQLLIAGTLDPPADELTVDGQSDEAELKFAVTQRKKRNDWTEYLDQEDNVEQEQNGDDEIEAMVVTEWQKGMFKKPRLEKNSTEMGTGGSAESFKPLFSKRNANKRIISQGVHTEAEEEPKKEQQMLTRSSSKWDNYTTLIDQRPQICVSRAASKWNDYVTQDDDNLQLGWGRGNKDHTIHETSVLEAITHEQRVEDHIHPDFL